jgi:hypothetical protein
MTWTETVRTTKSFSEKAAASAANSAHRGGKIMTPDKLTEQLRLRSREAQIDAFGTLLAQQARSDADSAVSLFLNADPDLAEQAQILLPSLEETAVVALVAKSGLTSATQRVWMLKQAVKAELALRRKVMARLDTLLDDREVLPQRLVGPIEQMPPERRVCDQAYLLMRKLVHWGELLLDASVEENQFLNLPDDLKDARIIEARTSGIWNRALSGHELEPPG